MRQPSRVISASIEARVPRIPRIGATENPVLGRHQRPQIAALGKLADQLGRDRFLAVEALGVRRHRLAGEGAELGPGSALLAVKLDLHGAGTAGVAESPPRFFATRREIAPI